MTSSSRYPAFAVLAAITALSIAAPALAQDAPPKPKSDLDRVGDSVENMAEKPLKDLNLMKDKIPPQLQAVMERPYDLRGIKGCSSYKAAIGRLNSVLGPDVDSPDAINQKATPAEFVLSSAESVVGGLIPGMGIVRKISGAEAAQKKAQAAVLAGELRRAYIKGTARAKGCKV
jgi:hypothetical protein